jgi:hypothetical protein
MAAETYAWSPKYFSNDRSKVLAFQGLSFGLPPPLRDQ